MHPACAVTFRQWRSAVRGGAACQDVQCPWAAAVNTSSAQEADFSGTNRPTARISTRLGRWVQGLGNPIEQSGQLALLLAGEATEDLRRDDKVVAEPVSRLFLARGRGRQADRAAVIVVCSAGDQSVTDQGLHEGGGSALADSNLPGQIREPYRLHAGHFGKQFGSRGRDAALPQAVIECAHHRFSCASEHVGQAPSALRRLT